MNLNYTTKRGLVPMPGRHILLVDDDRGLRHVLAGLLTPAGHAVTSVGDGPEAVAELDRAPFDILITDIGLPSMSGLDVLAHARALPSPPLVIVMTSDDTPETLLQAVKRQAYRYVRKPFAPKTVLEIIEDAPASAQTAALSFEVISATPHWLEILAPCSLEMADRVHSFVMHLEADLPQQIRESVALAFRELLNNAVEWGGKLDPTRQVRISCVRGRRMLIYRISDPGEGFDIDRLRHAALSNPPDDPTRHMDVRDAQGLRPGGYGLALTRSLVDELIYNEARNEVICVKHLD